MPDLGGVGQPAAEGDVLLQAAAVPDFDRLVAGGSGKEAAVARDRNPVDRFLVLCQVGDLQEASQSLALLHSADLGLRT